MSDTTKEYVEIPGSQWYVTFNPFGEGLALCVPRGINCVNHTQVFTGHCTNTPDWQDVLAEIDANAVKYSNQIDAFCTLMGMMNTNWATKEAISGVFCTALIKEIASASEERWERRQSGS